MKKINFIITIGIISLFSFYSSNIQSQTCTATMNGNWGTVFTGSCATYTINSGVTVTILNGTITIGMSESLIINNGGVLTISSGASLVNDGTITNNGSFYNNNILTNNSGATITNAGTLYNDGTSTFNNFGTFNQNGSGSLPIELTSFTGTPVQNTIVLKWASASEKTMLTWRWNAVKMGLTL